MGPATYGETFNVVREEPVTWREYYRDVARALDTHAELIFVPASWLIAEDPERFGFLAELSQFHTVFSSVKTRSLVPSFRPTTAIEAGARETFADLRRRGAWPDAAADVGYQRIVDRALACGFRAERA